MTKEQAIVASKECRVALDGVLQGMKDFRKQVIDAVRTDPQFDKTLDDSSETIAQHTISIRDLESAIMRQGMVLKAIGNPNPYPNSYKPENTTVDPTADGLKL